MVNQQRHKEITKEEFSRQADHIVAAPSFLDEDTLSELLKAVGATFQDRVLDVACGAGAVTFRLARTAREVVGLDITGEMLQRARKQRHEEGVANVHFQLGEAEALPFEDDEFDATVCRMSIHHFSNPEQALKEMKRVTRPGRRVVIADIVTSPNQEEALLHNAIERLRDPSHVRMLSQDELLTLVASSGLRIVHSASWLKQRHYEEWADVLGAPERIAPLRIVLEAMARANCRAGIRLQLDPKLGLTFDHQWLLVQAQRAK